MGKDTSKDRSSIGVDTGGTFTDVVLRDVDGGLRIYKLLSTPADPSQAIAAGVEEVLARDSARRVSVIHGTTVATNALLERRGARIAFVTTAGFEDLLLLRRQNRPQLYSFDIKLPRALVERASCLGVEERVLFDGKVARPLSKASVTQVVEAVAAGGFEAVAICLLHSYANDAHERQLAQAFAKHLPGVHVSVSHEVVREFREFERASTTSINAFVGPVMSRYLQALEERVSVERIEILQSHGGRTSVEHASQVPVHTILSGPAGGVVGAIHAANEVGIRQIITFDMGGTSTDVSLCNGKPTLTNGSEIDGLPVQVPVIDIYTVGAGGGSIAHRDPGGALRVGPRSAGASPGPASYGLGGVEPTVTDAHLVLGGLQPERFLGGDMVLDVAAAHRAVQRLGESLGLDAPTLARGILDVADASMTRAIKVISLERGLDPRDYCLASFGGAGGLHACRLAEALDMSRVLIPRHPGLLSAHGMLHADAQRLYSKTLLEPLDALLHSEGGRAKLRAALLDLRASALSEMACPEDQIRWELLAELRYVGQSFEIPVEVAWDARDEDFDDPTTAFEERHEVLYGYRAEQRPVELVTVRLKAIVAAPSRGASEERGPLDTAEPSEPARARQTITVGFPAGNHETALIDRAELTDGATFEGPCVITEYSGTTVVPPGWSGVCVKAHLVLTRELPAEPASEGA